MADTGWKAARTAANVVRASGLADWINPDNAKTDDENFSPSAVVKEGVNDWLRLTNFDFSAIPEGSTINGYEVEYRRYVLDYADSIVDDILKLRKTDGQVGDNKASATYYATSKETQGYGGAADTWNSGLTDSDIRDSGFGIDLSVFNANADHMVSARIFFCHIKVYYTEAAADEHNKSAFFKMF